MGDIKIRIAACEESSAVVERLNLSLDERIIAMVDSKMDNVDERIEKLGVLVELSSSLAEQLDTKMDARVMEAMELAKTKVDTSTFEKCIQEILAHQHKEDSFVL